MLFIDFIYWHERQQKEIARMVCESGCFAGELQRPNGMALDNLFDARFSFS
jgi:hypothetical protein